MDFSKGLSIEIIFTQQDYKWIQKLDYENVLFCCRACYGIRYLALTTSQKGLRKVT